MRNKKHRFPPTATCVLPRCFFDRGVSKMIPQKGNDCSVNVSHDVKTIPNLRSGFTLVEMIIYIAFFATLSVLALDSTLLVMKSFYNIRLSQNINQSATVGLERMSREIRNAYEIDTINSTFGTTPGRLTLKTKDSTGVNTTIEFYVSGSQLAIKEGGVDKGSLMTKNAVLTNLVFRQIANPNSRAVKIEMTIRDTRGVLQKDVNFYDTIVLRGSIN